MKSAKMKSVSEGNFFVSRDVKAEENTGKFIRLSISAVLIDIHGILNKELVKLSFKDYKLLIYY
jgi:hypothetical protein